MSRLQLPSERGRRWDIGTNSGNWVDPQEVAQLLQEDLAAIRDKVKNKKPLTTAEVKRLQTHAKSAEGNGFSSRVNPLTSQQN